jgi:hypothetical protein
MKKRIATKAAKKREMPIAPSAPEGRLSSRGRRISMTILTEVGYKKVASEKRKKEYG